MEFTYRIEVDLGFDAAIDAVTTALKEQGFGVLTRIGVQRTLKDELDVDVERQVILGASTPNSPTGPSRSTLASLRCFPATSSSAPRLAVP